mgnify:CR=1 FL=1
MAIQIVRFKDGLDVISNVMDSTDSMNFGELELSNPMVFEIRNAHLVLKYWLPLAVLKHDRVNINKNDILCRMDPNDDFKEYYTNAVNEMKKELNDIKNKKDSEESLDVMEAIAELSVNKNINIH